VLIERDATNTARKKYPLFNDMIIGRFDEQISLYRVFDAQELRHILSTGRITGGSYSVKAERDHGASWGWNVTEVITWGNGQRGKRLGPDLFLAKIDAFDKEFAHVGPELPFDPSGPAEQPVHMTRETCRTGVGCSVINVEVGDVDSFYRVGVDGQLSRVTLSELKAAA
jgi:hypothetical protein